jgi:hypothetical protein
MVESSSDDILKDADKVDVAFLVVGDPFGYVALGNLPVDTSNTPQSNHTHRPRTPCPRTLHPHALDSQRQHFDLDRHDRAAAVQLRADGLYGLLP